MDDDTPIFTDDLRERWRVTRQTIWRREKDGILPQRRYLGSKGYWKFADVRRAEELLDRPIFGSPAQRAALEARGRG